MAAAKFLELVRTDDRRPGTLSLLGGGLQMRVMLQESVDVARPLEAVWGHFLGDGSWFAPFATAAEEDGEASLFSCRAIMGRRASSQGPSVSLGPPHNRGEAIVVPLSWRSAALPGLFPVLDGDLVVSSVTAERCRITLEASYLPFGELGRQLDKALLNRVASSTARAFLDHVADSLEANAQVIELMPKWT